MHAECCMRDGVVACCRGSAAPNHALPFVEPAHYVRGSIVLKERALRFRSG